MNQKRYIPQAFLNYVRFIVSQQISFVASLPLVSESSITYTNY